MDTPHARLKAARIAAGFKSAANAASELGLNLNAYAAHENGNRVYIASAAKVYAAAFNTTPEWLIFGKTDGVAIPLNSKPFDIDARFLEIWKKLTFKQRSKLAKIALIISEE